MMMMPSLYCIVWYRSVILKNDNRPTFLLVTYAYDQRTSYSNVWYDMIWCDVVIVDVIIVAVIVLSCVYRLPRLMGDASLCFALWKQSINDIISIKSQIQNTPERSKKWLAFSDVLIICSKRDCNVLLITVPCMSVNQSKSKSPIQSWREQSYNDDIQKIMNGNK